MTDLFANDPVAQVGYHDVEVVTGRNEEGNVFETRYNVLITTRDGYRYGHSHNFKTEPEVKHFAGLIRGALDQDMEIDMRYWYQVPALYGSKAWQEESYAMDVSESYDDEQWW